MTGIRVLKLVVIWLCFLVSVCGLRNFYTADVAAESSRLALSNGEVFTALSKAQTALERNALEPKYYRDKIRASLTLLVLLSGDDYVALKQEILEDLQTAYKLNPDNLVTLRNLVPLYYFLALEDVSEQTVVLDPQFSPYTRDFYAQVKATYPNDVGVQVLIAKYERRLGWDTGTLDKIRELRPDLLDWYQWD